jgi:hypothetical protein
MQGDSPHSGAEFKNERSSKYVPLYEVYFLVLRDVLSWLLGDEWG